MSWINRTGFGLQSLQIVIDIFTTEPKLNITKHSPSRGCERASDMMSRWSEPERSIDRRDSTHSIELPAPPVM